MVSLAAFDTKTLANKGVTIFLRSLKDGSPTTASITVLGTDSDRFKDLQLERAREALDREARGLPEPSAEERDVRGAKTLAQCTVGWSGIEGIEDFSIEAAERLYLAYPAIREQINVAMADRRNFLLG